MFLSVIVAGGGIGGLTTALCLHKFGHDVTVLEQADTIFEVGAGLQISPNGMKVLYQLGLDEAVVARGFKPRALEMRLGRSGQQVFDVPLNRASEARWGGPYVHIHRADLIDILATALEARAPGALITGQTVRGYSQSAKAVRVQVKSGISRTADILIGADGLHSVVREQMLGPDEPRFTGNTAWRAVIPMAALGDLAPPPTACVWVGRGRHAVTYRLRGGELANLVGVVESDEPGAESWSAEGAREQAARDCAGWHPIVANMIDKADTLFRWALYDRAPFRTWTQGRVALLGDACHPMLPFAAQGAVMAMEDSWVLARELSAHPEAPVTALDRYFKTRMGRASVIQASSHANMQTFHKRTAFSQFSTYAPMWLAGKVLPGLIRANRDRVYAYDVTDPGSQL